MQSNEKLVDNAKLIIKDRYKEGFHHIGASIRTKSGNEYTAVHLETRVGRMAVCAEAIAIGMGAANSDTNIDTVVSVNSKGDIVTPCGMCREMISDYSPDAKIIIGTRESGYETVTIDEFLPRKHMKM